MKQAFFIVELTEKCNLSCVYCFQNRKIQNHSKNLSFKDFKKSLEVLMNHFKIESIQLTGGEPLLNKELFKILDYLKEKKIPVGISTNGLLLNQKNLNQFKNYFISCIEISLDTLNSLTYKEICGSKDLVKLKKSIMEVQKSGIPFMITSLINRLNAKEVKDLVLFADEMNAVRINLSQISYLNIHSEIKKKLELSQEQWIEVLNQAQQAAQQVQTHIHIGYPMPPCIMNTQNYSNLSFEQCFCGDIKYYLDIRGNLKTCEYNPEIIENVNHPLFENKIKSGHFKCQKNSLKCRQCLTPCNSKCNFIEYL